jgi:hypothetical protein
MTKPIKKSLIINRFKIRHDLMATTQMQTQKKIKIISICCHLWVFVGNRKRYNKNISKMKH